MKNLLRKSKVGLGLFRHHKGVVMGLFVAVCLGLLPGSARGNWEKTSQPPATEAPIDLALCAEKSECFYAATKHQVFRQDQGVWQPVFNLPSSTDEIKRIQTFPSSADLWIQTQQSIYQMHVETQTAEKIYDSSDSEKFPLAFFMDSQNFWVGTQSGLWNSKDRGKTWQKRSDLADHQPVSLIVGSGSDFFFSANGNWMKSENNSPRNLFKLFTFENREDTPDATLTSETEEEPSNNPVLSFFSYAQSNRAHYLASLQGVFKSDDGISWLQLSHSGFRSTAVSRILWDEKNLELLAVTKDGVFHFDESAQRWKSKNNGLAKLDVRALLILPNSENLIAANSEGLWTWKSSSSKISISPEQATLFNKLVSLEPSALDIHKHVIRYSDTSNTKIKRWHAESRLASLMPTLSLGKDWGASNNVDLDRAGTSDPDRFIDGPWNKDRGADLDLSWDLGDFIFSTSQTSIDSRAKLMVDLRNDLLSEATRLFYERRRLQAETIRDPATDEKTHLDRLLRIDELTSLLDVLTGGWLSEKLDSIYKSNTQLEEIWLYQNK